MNRFMVFAFLEQEFFSPLCFCVVFPPKVNVISKIKSD